MSTLPHSPFVSLSPGCQDTHKFTFLKSVYVLCKTALKRGLTQGLDLFCQTCEVVENIKVRGHLVFWGWGQAPLAPAPCVDSAWVGQGLEALGASSCQLPSWLCSAGHPGKGAKGPSVLTGPLSLHDCHRRIKVGLLSQSSEATCTRPRGAAPSTSVQLALLCPCSLVENVLEGKTKSLLSACFSSVFWLPSEREMPHSAASLYIKVSAG